MWQLSLNITQQSNWKALNLESDNEEEDEVDDTKEIQIEEALKLYQTALKSHAEGPEAFERTAEAYKALFESEIFKYTESLSEYKRHELYGEDLVFDTILQDDLDAGPVQTTGSNESAPNTLPQILHLSYKNRGQFMLETMQYWLQQHGAISDQQSSHHVVSALSYFAEALDKEDTDLDLWLRTASVAAMLGSPRLTRFCLEAVLDGNDELYDSLLRLPGLEEGFAGQQLRDLVSKLEDSLSLQQAPLSKLRRKKLSKTLKTRLNPYPFAPLPAEINPPKYRELAVRPPERITLTPAKWDWAGLGEVILRQYVAEQSVLIENVPPGSSICFEMPPETIAVETTEEANGREETVAPRPQEEEHQPKVEQAVAPSLETAAAIQASDPATSQVEKGTSTKMEESGSMTPVDAAQAQSRKRSTDSAGFPETAEGGRARSKRIRAREVTDVGVSVETSGQEAAKQLLEEQLWPCTYADQCLSEVVNDMYARLGVEETGSPKRLRDLVTNISAETSANDSINKAACDMYAGLLFSGAKVAPLLLSTESIDLGGASREAGLNAFLGYSKSTGAQACMKPTLQSENLALFVQGINDGWFSVEEVAFVWVEALLSPGSLSLPDTSTQGSKTSYTQYRWTDDLKRHLVQVIVNNDSFIYTRMAKRLEDLNANILRARAQSAEYVLSDFDIAQIEMLEALFELHLDVYSLIKHPNSGVDAATQTIQNDRLERWVSLAREAMQLRSDCDPDPGMDDLALRHIWASVFQMNVSDDISPQHVIFAMEELKEIFQSQDGRIIQVQNNAVMPELSVAAIDRELVRIGMKDFFLRVFDTDEKDPVAVIESLEPILEPVKTVSTADEKNNQEDTISNSTSTSPSTIENAESSLDTATSRPSPLREMRRFLDSASVNLRLSLWQRLREAYEAIEYQPKVLSCYLRSIETLTGEFNMSAYQESPAPDRYAMLVSRLRIIDEIVVKTLQMIRNEEDAFACLSYEHVQTSMSAIVQLLRIMSASNMLQDMVRIGHVPVPRVEGLPVSTFTSMVGRLNDIQVRLWTLQYYLLKEGIVQASSEFSNPSDEELEFLRHVHHALGVRDICDSSSRMFLRLAKDEILRFDNISEAGTRDTELCQLLYDLYGLKTFIDPAECQEYHSTPDILDKKTATVLLPFILSQSEKMNVKDLPKHDLKVTIEKVHGALGRPRPNEDISYNRKMITAFFKSPIKPVSLFNCLKGVGSLYTKNIPMEASVPASKGWYFLMGNIALNKFRSQKRHVQVSTEDLNFAQAFYLQDLEYSIERWETWYRLAQANDTQLEEAVSWSAEKLNNNSMELVTYQRAAIHCYTMAVACAVRDADPSSETRAKVAQLYADFGNRMYASSREPFSMSAFVLKDTEHKFYSGRGPRQEIYQNVPFSPLQGYTAWKFAGVLFKRAAYEDPDKWWNYYMRGKCLWKIYCSNTDDAIAAAAEGALPPTRDGPTWEQVVDAIINAIETVPEKKARNGEPILEPHYKLVSITHKLFQRKAIDHEQGVLVLQHTPFSHNSKSPDGADDWERYILSVLKELRNADKASWHHRITARAAHVIYDDSTDMMVAHGAKHELTQQIFTKTMAVQVWKPEFERPGRHFVYTTRYTRFFVNLLDQTMDKANLELLAKRVRKKQTDFFEHSKLWQDLCQKFLKLLRRMGQIPDGQEDTVFRALNYDEYNIQATRLETWCQDPATQHPALDVLRDVVELKRINNGLMKPVLIDDLLGDTFALLYSTVGSTLAPLPSEQPQQPFQIQPILKPHGQQPGAVTPLAAPILGSQIDGSNESHNAPFNLFHPSQLLPDPVVKTRAKTVGRREVQRRAEACAQKPAGAAPPPTTAIPIRSPVATTHATLLQGPQPPADKAPATNEPSSFSSTSVPPPDNLQVPANGSGTVTAPGSVSNVDNSAPPSVHDDADDESELSELDESEVQEIGQEVEAQRRLSEAARPRFPNLMASRESTGRAVEQGSDAGADDETGEEGRDTEDAEMGEGN